MRCHRGVGTFIQDLAAVEDGDPAESSVRRSQRRRTVEYYDEVQEEEIEEDSDYEAEEEDFCNSDERSLGLDSEDEADLSGDPEDEDVVPLSTRLNRMKSIPKEPVQCPSNHNAEKHRAKV